MVRRVKPLTRPPLLRLNARTGWPLGDLDTHQKILKTDEALVLSSGRSAISANEYYGSFGGRTLPRGLAISKDGRIFLVDSERREILSRLAAETDVDFAPLWPARELPTVHPHDLDMSLKAPSDPYTLIKPTDIAIAPNGDLVITDAGYDNTLVPHGRVLVISFPSGTIRHIIKLKQSRPFSVTFDAVGQAYIADQGLRTIHRFNRQWLRDLAFPHASTSFVSPAHVAAIAEEGGSCGCSSCETCNSPQPAKPIVYVIDDGKVRAILSNGRPAANNSLKDIELLPPALTELPDGTLEYRDLENPKLGPIRILGLNLLPSGREAKTGLPMLARSRKIAVPTSGKFTTLPLDGGRSAFAWDKITLALTMSINTKLLMRTLTSDSLIEQDRLEFEPESRWSSFVELTDQTSPEFLITSRPGRYLWLQVEMLGDGVRSPIIEEIDIYGPRQSSLQHLPSPFHEDPESAIFLDRFLSYFDTIFDEITASNRSISEIFDPKAVAEGEFLNWLGAWFGWEFLSEWSVETRRSMIAEAIPYYKMRGTVAGIRKILQWHTGLADPMPQIIEHFRLSNHTEPVLIGGTDLVPGSLAHSFTITLPASSVPTAGHRAKLEKLIAMSIPAHTRYQLRIIDPGVSIGTQSTIGIDTLLGSYPKLALGSAKLGEAYAENQSSEEALFAIPSKISQGSPKCQTIP